jgi:hypothetical protein
MSAPAPLMVAAAVGARSTTAPMREQASVSTTTPTAGRPTDASRHASLLREKGIRRQQLASSPSAAAAVEGRPSLDPTTKLPIPAVNTIHTFSAQSKLCFVRDRLSGKDFLVDTGATLSLLPHQSAAAATGPKLQSVKGQPIKTWNFVNTWVEFNGWDVPFPIIGLDFFVFFRDAGKPLIF